MPAYSQVLRNLYVGVQINSPSDNAPGVNERILAGTIYLREHNEAENRVVMRELRGILTAAGASSVYVLSARETVNRTGRASVAMIEVSCSDQRPASEMLWQINRDLFDRDRYARGARTPAPQTPVARKRQHALATYTAAT